MAVRPPTGRASRPAPGKSFCEFFAGIGLVREALTGSGWACVYANDIDPRKQQIYEARFGGGHFHLGDVNDTRGVVSRLAPAPFLATASFPCVDLSLAGHYRGFDGEHSSTFFAFLKVLDEMAARPRAVMVENVPGFLTARGGKDFAAAACALAERGYWLDAVMLDAAHFTPQSRPRVFLVGVDAGLLPPKDEGAGTGWLRSPPPPTPLRPASLSRFADRLQLPTGWVRFSLPAPPTRALRLAECIDTDDGQAWWERGEVERHHRMMSELHRVRVDRLLRAGEAWVGTIFRRIRQKAMRAEVRFDGLAGCLRTPRGGSAKQIVVATDAGRLRMRWMTPREYARLQGVPDFPLVGTTIQQLWGFADAVCVPAVAWIDRHLLTPLFDRVGSPSTRARRAATRAAV